MLCLLLLCVPAAVSAADTAPYAPGFALLERQDYAGAYDWFAPRLLETPDDLDLLYGFGVACVNTGRHSHAVYAFETLLERQPQAHPVRFELARAYLAVQRYDDARRELQAVLDHDPPEAVRQAATQALTALDEAQRTPVVVSGSLGVYGFSCDNVNAGISSNDVLLSNVSYAIDDASQRRSDNGLIGLGAVALTGQPWRDTPLLLRPGVTVYQKWHDSFRDNDLTYVAPALTLLWQAHPRLLLSAGGEYQHIDYDYRALSRVWEAELAGTFAATQQVALTTTLTYAHTAHKTTYGRSGNTYTVGESVEWALTPALTATLSGEYARQHAVADAYASRAWAGDLGLTAQLPWSLTGTVAGGLGRTRYDDPSTSVVTYDRSDRLWDITCGLSRTLAGHWTVSYTFTREKNNSNTDIHDYTTNTHTFGVVYGF